MELRGKKDEVKKSNKDMEGGKKKSECVYVCIYGCVCVCVRFCLRVQREIASQRRLRIPIKKDLI